MKNYKIELFGSVISRVKDNLSPDEAVLSYEAGILANYNGEKKSSCPFTLSQGRKLWLRGWVDQQDANRKSYNKKYYIRREAIINEGKADL